MTYFYLRWTKKRPSLCTLRDTREELDELVGTDPITFECDTRIRGCPDIFETVHVCGTIGPELADYTTHPEKSLHKTLPAKIYQISHLQKSLRKMKVDKSVKTAKHLLDEDPVYLLRRLPILMFEDVIPHESLIAIMWLTMACGKGFRLKTAMVEWLLGVVHFLASSPGNIRTENPTGEPYECQTESICPSVLRDISGTESDILRCIILRISYGGMKGDMGMLRYFTTLLSGHFRESRSIDRTKIRCIQSDLPGLDRGSWDLCANDFHCNHSLLPNVRKKYPQFSEDYLKGLIWNYSSGPNVRFKALPPNDDWLRIKPYVRWLQSQMIPNRF